MIKITGKHTRSLCIRDLATSYTTLSIAFEPTLIIGLRQASCALKEACQELASRPAVFLTLTTMSPTSVSPSSLMPEMGTPSDELAFYQPW